MPPRCSSVVLSSLGSTTVTPSSLAHEDPLVTIFTRSYTYAVARTVSGRHRYDHITPSCSGCLFYNGWYASFAKQPTKLSKLLHCIATSLLCTCIHATKLPKLLHYIATSLLCACNIFICDLSTFSLCSGFGMTCQSHRMTTLLECKKALNTSLDVATETSKIVISSYSS